MSPSLFKQLKQVGTLLGLDCGDNSCAFAEHKGGMRTNGGCRCDLVSSVAECKAKLARVEALPHRWSTMLNEFSPWDDAADELRTALKGTP